MDSDNAPATCETIEPLLAAYALGERDPAAQAAIAGHLAGCAACRRTLAADRNVAAALPLTVAEATPAPALRRRVVDAVGAAASGRLRRPAASARRSRLWAWALRGGLALVFAGLLAWNLALQQSLAHERAARREQSLVFATLLQSTRLERIPLQADSPGPTGTLLLDPQARSAALSVADMPPLPAGKVYQLWLVRDGQRVSGGTFTVDAAGAATHFIAAPEPLAVYQAVGVTVEPRGGSPGPTSPRVIGGPISS